MQGLRISVGSKEALRTALRASNFAQLPQNPLQMALHAAKISPHSDSMIRGKAVMSGVVTLPSITDLYVTVPFILPTNAMMSSSRMRTGAS